jgi:hypothetical protein
MNNDPSNKRLIDEENYKTTFSLQDLDSSLLVYARIISNFIKDMSEDIDMLELNHFMFILEKGIETITNVYKTILLYTRNVELAEYHTGKSGIYYIEFISQIIGSEVNIRESVLFVYKKTIFEINNECKKRVVINAEQNVYFTILDETTLFFHIFIKSILSERNVAANKAIMGGILNEKIIEYSKKLFFSNDLTDCRMSKLKYLNSLVSGLSILKCTHIRMFNIIDSVLKKIVKMDDADLYFSMEKLTNAVDNNYSPLKTASHVLLT